MQGLIQKLQGEFTDNNLPRYYPKDNMLNKGTMFMFDVSKDTCYLSQASSVANGTALKNLVDGAADATVNGTGVTYTAGKGFKFGNTSDKIQLGTSYNIAALGNVNIMLSQWLKWPSGGEENTTAFQRLLTRGLNTATPTNIQFHCDTGADGKTPRGIISNGTSHTEKGTAVTLAVVHHIAFIFENNNFRMFLNNVEVGTAVPLTGPLYAYIGEHFIGPWNKGTVYRFSLENLTASGNSGVAQVANEYTRNTGKFS